MRDAAELADYFERLGVSHLYLSPILQSAPGSPHGYDGVDPTRLDDDRGGEAGFESLRNACAQRGLGLILDIVPNHLDVSSPENRWWRSVLELGEASPFADSFDIDWDEPGVSEAEQGVVVPVLGERLPDAVESGDIRLTLNGGTITARYFDHEFPLSPATVADLLQVAAERSEAPVRDRLAAAAERFRDAAAEMERDEPEAGAETLEASKGHLRNTLDESPAAGGVVERTLAETSRDPEALERVLEAQNYRLMFWRRAARSLNYRRFFNINTLVGVRVERPEVFDAVHELPLRLGALDGVDGLRVDHPDGLRDPAAYFRRLRQRAPEAWLLAEKILEPGEALRSDWPIDGTTGYDFLNQVLGAMVDPEAEEPLTALYQQATGAPDDSHEIEFEAKWNAARRLLAADLARLVRIVQQVEGAAGFERAVLADAIALLAACFPVYRSYAAPERGEIADEDRRLIDEAHRLARRRRPDVSSEALEFIKSLLTLERTPPPGAERPAPEDEFAARFQQYSAPVTAKGVEDTAFYRFHRFIALNEVGGTPQRFGSTIDAFHAANIARASDWPASMLATSTHDTKRSEDVRARLAVLSEMPDEWAGAVRRWSSMNEALRTEGPAEIDRKTEYLLYQTLIGAWPLEADRAAAFMLKAAKEAKERTSWVDPDENYEEALERFTRGVLKRDDFVADVERFAGRLLRPGRVNSLAQALLKFTAPGVPDIYQGCELWDLSLVDPDNRRPVDYDLRRRLLSELDGMAPQESLSNRWGGRLARLGGPARSDSAKGESIVQGLPHSIWPELDDPDDPGLPKLFLTATALRVRHRHAAAFGPGGGYQPLEIAGERAENVIAFARLDAGSAVRTVTVVPRLTATLESWGDTAVALPKTPGRGVWIDHLSGARIDTGRVRAADLFRDAPLSLLTEEKT